MLQVDIRPFASDALEDAMRLAQTKALNSYTFSDCMNYLNYAWADIYKRLANIDDGYYGQTVRLTSRITKLPKYVMSTLQVYAAQTPTDHMRHVFRSAGVTELPASGEYRVSGTDLLCPDAERRTVWLYYMPQCPQLFFTHHNRDPKILEPGPNEALESFTHDKLKRNDKFGQYRLKLTRDVADVETGNVTEEEIPFTDTELVGHEELALIDHIYLVNRASLDDYEDVTDSLKIEENEDGAWKICFVSCDFPYIFVTYEHSVTREHASFIYDRQLEPTRYNPFDFTGRNSDVEYLDVHWNDKTGMGVVVKDYNDVRSYKYIDPDTYAESTNEGPAVKELGWTPDTQLDYPAPEMYRYLVARLADKFAALNESNVMGVQKELLEARFAFEAYLDKDKSSWKRINNVNPPSMTDWL